MNINRMIEEIATLPISKNETRKIEEINKQERLQGRAALEELFAGKPIGGEIKRVNFREARQAISYGRMFLEDQELEKSALLFLLGKNNRDKAKKYANTLLAMLEAATYWGIISLDVDDEDGKKLIECEKIKLRHTHGDRFESARWYYEHNLENIPGAFIFEMARELEISQEKAKNIVDTFHRLTILGGEIGKVIENGKLITMQIGETLWRSGDESHVTEEDKKAWAAYLEEIS